MPSLLQNKYIRFGLFGVGALIALYIVMYIFTGLSATSVGLSSGQKISAPSIGTMMDRAYEYDGDMMAVEEMSADSYYPSPIPEPAGYVDNLEAYETTDYHVSARTRQFDEFCANVRALKAEDRFNFKHLDENTNHCSATFYTEEAHVGEVLDRFRQFSGIEIARTTNSVTQQKERLTSQTDILRQQLMNVDRTLTAAETQFDEVIEVARASNNATELARAISEKLRMIDTLTQRKINLTSQINNLLQQSAELNERLGVVQFSVSVTRSVPIYPDEDGRKWEQAWEELTDAFTATLMGLSTGLGVFLLTIVQYGLYLIILILIARFGWKLVLKMWKL